MNENHQNKTDNKLIATEDKSQLPLWSPEDEKKARKELAHLQKNERRTFKATHKQTGFEDKTLWDKLNLLGTLAIPLIIALATVGVGLLQLYLADVQHQQDKADASDQQRAAILQTYIDNIQDLLLNHNLQKSSSFDPTNQYYDVAILARARTLTALQGLDPERKGRLLIFLYEAKLIGFFDHTNRKISDSIIDLTSVNLEGAHLSGAHLEGANLSYADLRGAHLEGANLSDADLDYATLSDASFNTVLNDSPAFLSRAKLLHTYLDKARLSGTQLDGAVLSFADLSGAHLEGADLSYAQLNDANLNDANLSYADNLIQQQLDEVSTCSTDTTLPKGLTCP